MNRAWSESFKEIQLQLKKQETYGTGLENLLSLRGDLFDVLLSFRDGLTAEQFSAIPFINANGYHNKTIGYSIWHIFRIEDIVSHTLIAGDEQIFSSQNYQDRIHSPLITTGNELEKLQIADFSKRLDLGELYAYSREVKESTETLLKGLPFGMLKRKISPESKENLKRLEVVSDDEKAVWLVDYWCSKDILGLILMPFSRHWIMHTEASLRIRNKLEKI